MAIRSFGQWQNIFVGMARAGTSANEALRLTQAQGFTMRRTDFLQSYRELAGIPAKQEVVKYTPTKYAPTLNAHVILGPEAMKSNYRYTIRTDTVNAYGFTKSGYVSMKYDTAQIIDTIRKDVESLFKANDSKYEYVLTFSAVTMAYKRESPIAS